MTINLESFRYPFEAEITNESEGAKIAHRSAFQGILDLNQAVASLKSQLTTATTTTTTATTTSTTAETIIEASTIIGTVNNQTGVTSYTTQQSDYGAFVLFSDASPIAVTLATAGSSPGISLPWYANLLNFGAGMVTLTPSSGTITYPNNLAAASMPVIQGYAAVVAYDGTNFWAELIEIPTAAVNFADDETVSGSGTAWTLAHTPAAGSVPILVVQLPGFGGVVLLLGLTPGFTISGAAITTTSSYLTGALRAWYRY